MQYLTFVDDVSLAVSNAVQENSNNGFTVFPNPNTGKFIIKLNDIYDKNTEITITNQLGQLVYKTNPNSQFVNINLNGIAKGLYLIKINNKNLQSIKKIHIN